ncbi:alpha/beta fold hydrolase [Streptomyces erythrochromogenes]|uniref:alpha/beta fold hydrolase n=1 Tax=Streptomyces erythrochromogenes TaxID=285574 RepID=UPI0022513EF1|nr:alpha/beta hydrolase [Streptomyces erythrochromogenes]MCX5583181.1 alpha/beta hydrolase [Streptomyces erythrochromogenes]
MTAVFVHGVPETGDLWDRLRARLGTASVALRLPGFGAPLPDGFGSSMDEYVEWMEGELHELNGPIDLVGHDWGGLLVARIATRSRVTLRSWSVDVAGILHPAYVWHDIAQLWQTPVSGEAWATATLEDTEPASPLSASGQLRAAGAPEDDARAMGESFDATMASSVLALYRSATPNPFARWGTELMSPTSTPGLVLHPTLDPFDGPASQVVAATLGAHFEPLEGLGHWWMLQDPATAAGVLEKFWADLGA